ncbi:MAG: hypothetical protein IJZ36_05530 [Bacilli bacterium]|nr:hypothetical protein [Bacilli bacterium]
MKKLIPIILISFIIVIILCNNKNMEDLSYNLDNVKVEDMSLREKIGQMLVVYYSNDYIDEYLINSLKENQPGGFIITQYNFTNFKRAKNFITSLNNYTKLPMFITIDQESKDVQRLIDIEDIKSTRLPDMSSLEINNDDTYSYNIGKIIGEEVRSLGINTVYSPCIDTGDSKTSPMGDRLISKNPNIVSRHGSLIAKGIIDSNVIPVYKHFPGIGDTLVDTHDDIPVINKTKEELYNYELIPFIDAINNGANMIMVGHASYPNLTNNNIPASLSKEIITDLLRNELGYNGIVITDAINMGALVNSYNEKDIYAYGINAGVDMFIMPNGSKRVITLIEELVYDGVIDEALIDRAVNRILKVKKEFLSNFTPLDDYYFGNEIHYNMIKTYN